MIFVKQDRRIAKSRFQSVGSIRNHESVAHELRSLVNANELAAVLADLDVRFLRSETHSSPNAVDAKALLAALATSEEARLRLALIPLLLRHPEYAANARDAAARLSGAPQIVLMCYYTAAHYLQQRAISEPATADTPIPQLPDLFSQDLCLDPTNDSDKGLHALAARQQILSGCDINWLGTYEHGARRWLAGRERELL